MKQHYSIKALDTAGSFPVSVSVHCTQYQARRIFTALSYACASDGGFVALTLALETQHSGSVPVERCRFGEVA